MPQRISGAIGCLATMGFDRFQNDELLLFVLLCLGAGKIVDFRNFPLVLLPSKDIPRVMEENR
jgi:hypothetical protein